MDERKLKRRAQAAVQKRQEELLELGELLCKECPEDVVFSRLATAFEMGWMVGHMAGRADAFVIAESLAKLFTES